MPNFMQDQRTNKLNVIVSSIKKAEKEWDEVKEFELLGEISKEFGASSRTAREYLNDLEKQGRIVLEYGRVWSVKGWKAHLEALESIKWAKEHKREQNKEKELNDKQDDVLIKNEVLPEMPDGDVSESV